uniref:Cytosolic beta-glucosidase n=1 Tax=Knipowitschia caucasica TaxID=637954 RepID=A0AAV2L0A3_KNICA
MTPSALALGHVLVLVLCLSAAEDFDWTNNQHGSFYYGAFPTGFSWGAGSSAYQTEGAWDKDGKGLSIWDVFSHKKGKIQHNQTGDTSGEGYYKVKDDVSLMKEMKLNHYRFSISWPRLIPTGIKSDHVNERGIQYYDELLDALLENNITPIVTLSSNAPHLNALHLNAPHLNAPHLNAPHLNAPHLNAPHLNAPNLNAPHLNAPHLNAPHLNAPHLNAPYLNAPNLNAQHLNAPHLNAPHLNAPHLNAPPLNAPPLNAQHLNAPHQNAPHLNAPPLTSLCGLQVLQEKYGGWQNLSIINHFNDYANLCFEKFGNRVKHWITFNNPWSVAVEGYETGEHAPGLKLKGTGAYKAAHHIIKAHAKVWHSYDTQWRAKQKGSIGISLSGDWGEPVDLTDQKDIEAAERYVQFYLGWFATPIFHGDYPQVMKDFIGRKSAQQGLGTSRLPSFSPEEKSYIKGTCDFLGVGHFTTRYVTHKNNVAARGGSSYFQDRDLAELVDPRWPDPGSEWLYAVPWGFRRLLNFVKSQYGNPTVYVTENGVSEKMQCPELCDEWRIQYFRDYTNEMLKAIKDGVNVKGYTAWSLLDKFEWDEGFTERFGLYFVDFRNKNKARYPKASVHFYKSIISSNGFPNQREVENWRRKAVETCSSSNQLLAADPLTSHMEMVTEIVVPTVCTLSILICAVLLMFLLRRRS